MIRFKILMFILCISLAVLSVPVSVSAKGKLATAGFTILELLSENGEMSVSEVAAGLGIHRSASYRFLASLKQMGYVVQEPDSRYKLSFKLFELGMKLINSLEIKQVARPYMQELSSMYNETVNLGYWNGVDIIYLDKIESSELIRIDLAVGRRIPIYCTALGKSILAFPEKCS